MKDAIKKVSEKYKINKNLVYDASLKLKNILQKKWQILNIFTKTLDIIKKMWYIIIV